MFSRSNAYFILSFITACSQVILRSSLYTVDHAESLRSSAVLYPDFTTTLPPSQFPASSSKQTAGVEVSQGLGFNYRDLSGDGRAKLEKRQPDLTAEQFLWALLPNDGFEVCHDLPGQCWTFTLLEIETGRNNNSSDPHGAFDLCPFIAAYTANL